MNNSETVEAFVEALDSSKKKDPKDLSSDQDLSIALMNLVSLEEHFFFTQQKTGKTSYLDLLDETRAMRKELLGQIVQQPEGEVWCISKHLLAASMRLYEVGTKQLGDGNKEKAQSMFDKAFSLYSLFWGLNLNMIDVEGVKQIDDAQLSVSDNKKTGFSAKLSVIVKKVIDCCLE